MILYLFINFSFKCYVYKMSGLNKEESRCDRLLSLTKESMFTGEVIQYENVQENSNQNTQI